jgi:signal peptidase I
VGVFNLYSGVKNLIKVTMFFRISCFIGSILLPGSGFFWGGYMKRGIATFILTMFLWVFLRSILIDQTSQDWVCVMVFIFLVMILIVSAIQGVFLKGISYLSAKVVVTVILGILFWYPNGLLFYGKPYLFFRTAKGISMYNAINSGDILLCRKYRDDENLRRNQIVVTRLGEKNRKALELREMNVIQGTVMKRIVGLPDERVIHSHGELKIQNKSGDSFNYYSAFELPDIDTFLGKDRYFLRGDNYLVSTDSRVFGPIDKKEIQGLAVRTIFPKFKKLSKDFPNSN